MKKIINNLEVIIIISILIVIMYALSLLELRHGLILTGLLSAELVLGNCKRFFNDEDFVSDPSNQREKNLRALSERHEESALDFSSISAARAGDLRTTTINDVEYNFRYCPPGTFAMGSPEDEPDRGADESLHEVTLSRGFWLLETEVTQAMWKSVMGYNPSAREKDELPLTNVSFGDVEAFLWRLNQLAPSGVSFRLPTEAEWEYACRAGSKSAYPWGSVWSDSNALAKRKRGPACARKYPPNRWGVYDMTGNIWEWISDWYGDYPNDAVVDPQGPTTGSCRVLRGGCWRHRPENCRSANRNLGDPTKFGALCGFRIAVGASDEASSSDRKESRRATQGAASL